MLQNTRIVDCGDVDIAYYGIDRNMPLITQDVKVILARKALPVLLGGDHSVSFPIVQVSRISRRSTSFMPLDIVHVDSHLDFIDDVEGLKFASGSPLRRTRELSHMIHFGTRDIRSHEADYQEAARRGSRIFTREEIREVGTKAVIEELPEMGNIYVTIDVDGLDPSIAPGTG